MRTSAPRSPVPAFFLAFLAAVLQLSRASASSMALHLAKLELYSSMRSAWHELAISLALNLQVNPPPEHSSWKRTARPTAAAETDTGLVSLHFDLLLGVPSV